MPVNNLAVAFRLAASDGKITDLEVRSALRLASRNTLTGAEQKTLGSQLKLRGDAFEPDAQVRLSRFVKAANGPANSADPRVMAKDRATTHYRPVAGGVYRAGVSARDVVQGQAGDCYVLATLSAAAKMRPGLIADAITQKSDGSFLVRFYGKGADGKPVPVYVPVDRELPGDRRGTRYARSSARGELWVSLVEKAFAKWKGGYEQIGKGGAPSDVMTALTGKEATWSLTADGTPDELFARLRAQLNQKGMAVASTRPGAQYRGTGVVASHAYTVLDVSEKNGVKSVLLRNPWGKTEPGQPRSGDGVFSLPLARFITLFPDLFLGGQ